MTETRFKALYDRCAPAALSAATQFLGSREMAVKFLTEVVQQIRYVQARGYDQAFDLMSDDEFATYFMLVVRNTMPPFIKRELIDIQRLIDRKLVAQLGGKVLGVKITLIPDVNEPLRK